MIKKLVRGLYLRSIVFIVINNYKLNKYILLLVLTLLSDALSVIGISYLLNEKKISYISFIFIFIIIFSAISHILIPIIIYRISKILREKILLFAYNLKDSNYNSLEGAIQKDEMIYFNLIVSDISIFAKLISILFIVLAVIFTTTKIFYPALIILPLTIVIYRKFCKKRQANISKNISANFHDITEIRKSGSVLSKSIFFNRSYAFIGYINQLYDNYYSELAKQNSLSNGYRTAIEISAYLSIVVIGYFSGGDNILKPLILIGYSGVKLLPIVQQLNFYISVRKNGKDQLDLIKNSNVKFKQLDKAEREFLYEENSRVLWIRGKSGSGKTTLMDSIANDLLKNNLSFGYYVQNQFPLRISKNSIENKWVPSVDSLESILSGKYSIGEIQRLAIFDITSDSNNKYVLLDEPFSSQSENFVYAISSYINLLSDAGIKIIIISHMNILPFFKGVREVWCNYDRNYPGANQ